MGQHFIYGDRMIYRPYELDDSEGVAVKVVGNPVRQGGRIVARVETVDTREQFIASEDELSHPDVQQINPDDVSVPVTMTALRCGCNWIVQGHREVGDTAWCPSHAEHSEITSACQSYVV